MSRKYFLVLGVLAGIATAAASGTGCGDDKTTGGSGGTGNNGGGGSGNNGGSAGGPGVGGGGMGGAGGGTGCGSCLDYLNGDSTLEGLCGFVSQDPRTGEITCDADSSCELLGALQQCSCVDSCMMECADSACMGNDPSSECTGCVTSQCLNEYMACSGDT
jgi:hypothetical protein